MRRALINLLAPVIVLGMVWAAGCSSKGGDEKSAPPSPLAADSGAAAGDVPPADPPAVAASDASAGGDPAAAPETGDPDPAAPAGDDPPAGKPADLEKPAASAKPAKLDPNAGPPRDLRVLPKTWTREQVTEYMEKQVERGLGVKCAFCHDEDDYAADHKHKGLARKMIQMTDALNREFFDGKREVTCMTCHNGKKEP